VRGDLLEKLGRFDEVRSEFEHAAALALNARKLLLDRAVGARKHMWGHEDRHAQDSGRSS